MQENARARLKLFFTLAVLLTVAMGTIYGVAQQGLRQSANDPQIQLAEDWADQLNSGAMPTSIAMGSFIDPNHSLAPFGIIYSQDGNVASSSVTAPTTMLQPDGVLGAVDRAINNEISFTWQPASGKRFAAVIKRITAGDGKQYYVLAGRNLREVEKRENNLMWLTGAAWLAGLVLVFLSMHIHLVPRAAQHVRRRFSRS
ncbi:MAG TPA: hypothetical protein VLG40_00555 [Candidatus Saccharimonas sp.]|nr:hypothetical protein [Candidatus Saccharimonas sp.]